MSMRNNITIHISLTGSASRECAIKTKMRNANLCLSTGTITTSSILLGIDTVKVHITSELLSLMKVLNFTSECLRTSISIQLATVVRMGYWFDIKDTEKVPTHCEQARRVTFLCMAS